MKVAFRLLVITLLFTACDPVRKLTVEGSRLQQAGNYDEAANYFYNALLKRPNDKISKNGLQETAQKVLDQKFEQFGKLVIDNKIAEAIRQYRYNEKYYARVKQAGVELRWTTMYDEVYTDIRNEYIRRQYDEALSFIRQNKYDRAEELFTSLADIDSSYRDVSVTRMNTVVEPLYQHGVLMMEKGNYEEAWKTFDKILTFNGDYKDTKTLRERTSSRAAIYLTILPIRNESGRDKEERFIEKGLLAELKKVNNPFLQVIPSLNAGEMFTAHAKDSPVQALVRQAKDRGYTYLLLLNLRQADYENINPYPKNEIAYEAFSANVQDPQTGTYNYLTRFKKVNFKNFHQLRRVAYRVSARLVSVASGESLLAEEYQVEKTDEQTYALFDGDPARLYPALPSGNFLPPAPDEWRARFSDIQRSLLSFTELSESASSELVKKLRFDIEIYLK